MENTNDNLEKWKAAAYAIEEVPERLPMPMHVLSGEAVDVARFFESYWQSTKDEAGKVIQPGLDLVQNERFGPEVGTELIELQSALQDAQTAYRLAVSPPAEAPGKRAGFVLGEIEATLEFLLSDGVDDVEDARLEALAEAHEGAVSQDALAAALEEYAGLAELHRERMHGLGGFDTALIDEARELAGQLRERSASKVASDPSSAQRQALDLRNRLGALLYERMQAVRTAARFVFRHDPEVVRKVTSAYQRRRVARARRARREASNEITANA